MRYPTPLFNAVMTDRRNRFVAGIQIAGRAETAYIPTTGRLGELLYPGAALRVEAAAGRAPKQPFVARQARGPRGWVNLTALHANRLFAEAVARGLPAALAGWRLVRPEVRWGQGRFDWLLERDGRPLFVEVKSVTLVTGGTARFPDAPTERGARHLRELAVLARSGHAAAVVFVAQRADARQMRANDATDPDFAAALGEAAVAGVSVLALRCRVSAREIIVSGEIPVLV